MSQEQIGAQIKCQIPPNLPFQDLVKIERECLNSPLISVKNFDVYGQQLNKNILPRKYDYYRWIVAVLMVLVFITIVPLAYFKRVINDTPLAEELLYQEAVKIEDKADQIIQYATIFAEYLDFERIKQSNSFAVYYCMSKMITISTPIVLFSILQLFIDAPHFLWFVESTYKMIYGTEQEIEPFPTNVYCSFMYASHMHTSQYTIACFLEFNIFFEKFSTILSIWHIILFTFNFVHCFLYLIWLFFNREQYVVKRFFYNKVEISEDDLKKFIKNLGWDGYMMSVKLEERLGYQFVSKFLTELQNELVFL